MMASFCYSFLLYDLGYVTVSYCRKLSAWHTIQRTYSLWNNPVLKPIELVFKPIFFCYKLVKLHSLKIKAPTDKGPKTVKLFINQPRTLDFDQAAGNSSVQELE